MADALVADICNQDAGIVGIGVRVVRVRGSEVRRNRQDPTVGTTAHGVSGELNKLPDSHDLDAYFCGCWRVRPGGHLRRRLVASAVTHAGQARCRYDAGTRFRSVTSFAVREHVGADAEFVGLTMALGQPNDMRAFKPGGGFAPEHVPGSLARSTNGVTTAEPLFSVVIPTFSRAKFLSAAVESVLAQTVDDWECVVVVDGGDVPSTPTDRRIKVLRRMQNGGPGAARNTGLECAKGKHIAFLDDDDVWVPDRLEMALSGLQRAPVVVSFGINRGELAWQGEWEGDVSRTLLEGKVPSLNGVAVRSDVAVRFDERLRGVEDVDWLLRVAQAAKFATVPRAAFIRRNAGTHRPDAPQRLDSLRLFMEIHAEYLRAHPRAAVRRWQLLGDAAFRMGRVRDGHQAYWRALRLEPSRRNVARWFRALRSRSADRHRG